MIIKIGDNMINKKAVSPVIATVLLIVMVIVIGLIIFLWFRSFIPEQKVKFGRNIELACADVAFQSGYDSSTGTLTISNTGTIPIYSINLKITKGRGHTTTSITELDSGWPLLGLRQGILYNSIDLSSEFDSPDEILIIPILAGTSEGEDPTHVCNEEYGQELNL